MRTRTAALLLAVLLAAPCGAGAPVRGRAAWSAFLAAPAARPLLASLGLERLHPQHFSVLAGVLSEVGVAPAEIEALAPSAAQALVREKAEAHAAVVVAAGAPAEAVSAIILAALAPRHAAEVRKLAEVRIEEARQAWGANAAGTPVPGAESALRPARAISLGRAAAATEKRVSAGRRLSEDEYRAAGEEALFPPGTEPRRMDTLLSRQAADPAQAMLEVIANAQDAGAPGKKVGRFGVGGLQVLGELKEPGDRVVLETSKGDGRGAQFVFWKKDGEVFFDWRLIETPRRGTVFRVSKKLGPEEALRRKEFLERKLRANDRGPILWASGDALNRPETFREWGGAKAAPRAAPVRVSLDASGYEVEDSGVGMGLKEVFERYLKPYSSDKPVTATGEAARLFYRDSPGAPRASLGVTTVEIERVDLAAAGRRLNLAGDVFVDLPHDTELTEDRGQVALVSADQSVGAAVRGLKLLIDRLTEPAAQDPARFALINSLAALIREKQPARERGLTRGDPKTATDLLWYLRQRLARSGLVDSMRRGGTAFLPNAPRWSPLEGLSSAVVFLDEALFEPTASDYAAAGLEELPAGLSAHPAWKAFASRHKGVAFRTRQLRKDGAAAIVDERIVVIDKGVLAALSDPEVLAARLERELRAPSAVLAPPARPRGLFARVLRPLVLIAALAAGPVVYLAMTSPPAAAPAVPAAAAGGWEAHYSERREMSGNPSPPRQGQGGEAAENARPSRPFGTITPAGVGDPQFVSAVRSRLTEGGAWAREEAPWAEAPAAVGPAVSLDVTYRLALSPRHPARLFNQINGRISGVRLLDGRGREIPHAFDPRTDELSVPAPDGHTGAATVSYRIELARGTDANALAGGAEALPYAEILGFPRQWTRELQPFLNAPDAAKLAAIERVMARDFVYDFNKPFKHDGVSWGHTAQAYLDRGEPVPIICNTSALYYYLMARTLGLPAAYVTLEDSDGGVFYHDLIGHAKVLVKADGAWRFVETTEFMPLVSAAPRVRGAGGPAAAKDDEFWKELLSQPERAPSSGPALPSNAYDLPESPLLKLNENILKGMLGLCVAALAGLLGWGFWQLFKLYRALKPLRRAMAAFGAARQRLPGAWLWWTGLAKSGIMVRWEGPWGTAWREPKDSTIYLADRHGALRRVSLQGGQEPQAVDGRLLVSRNGWFGNVLSVYNGKTLRTIYSSFWRVPRLVPGPGPRRYAVIGRRLVRLDLEAGRHETVLRLPASGMELKVLESAGGAERFVAIRPAGWGTTGLRAFSVSGRRAAWEGPEQFLKTAWSRRRLWKTWSAAGAAAVEFVEKPRRGAERAVLSVLGRGAFTGHGKVQAVLAGKVFVSGPKGARAYDIASGNWEAASLNGMEVFSVDRVGEGVFYVEAALERETRRFFADENGAFLAYADEYRPAAAVRGEGVVYYRPQGFPSLFVVSPREGQARHYSLELSPERLYSRAAARAAGLEAETLESLDFAWGAAPRPLVAPAPARGLGTAAGDRAWLQKLEPGLKAALPYRAASMPEWSPARLFLGPDTSRAELDPAVLARLDGVARANAARPEWLRAAFELIDRIYRPDSNPVRRFPRAAEVAGHYLDILAAMPEILDDLRAAVLEPLLRPDGSRLEPLLFLRHYSERHARELPAATQLYLQMLAKGPESLLRREAENAPEGEPAFALETRGESLSRLIAAARGITDQSLDAEGLPGFARAYAALAPGESADLSAVRGVVRGQGIAAPVWIRELIQNARDAVREARRLGRGVPAKIALRSYLSQDGSRWIVSVQDGVGMKLSRMLKALLIPEATTKTMADEVQGFLALGGTPEEKVERLLAEFFDDAARQDASLRSLLRLAVALPAAEAARQIAARFSERMRKGGAGFFGIGFFTVFGGADEVVVRTGAQGKLREATLVPVRDEEGRLVDIRVERVADYDDIKGEHVGTTVLRVKKVTPDNMGRLLVENAYAHIMAGKYAGAVSDLEITLNGESIRDGLAVVGERAGLRSRLGSAALKRWTVDELFVQEPPAEGLAWIPQPIRAALLASGWNVDFPAATAVVRTRASLQSPERHAAAAAALALPAAYALYRRGALYLPGLPSFAEHRRTSPWDAPPPEAALLKDAAAVASGAEPAALWERHGADPRAWARLMLAVHDDHELALREVLGPALSAKLDAARGRGEPLGVGPLPGEGTPDYAKTARRLHEEALERAHLLREALLKEPAGAGLSRLLGRLSAFMEDPPPFVPAGPKAWEGARRLLDEGRAVPLMEALLEGSGRTSDAAAVGLFEGWLKSRGAKKELEALLLGDASRAEVEASLEKLWKAASRGRPPLLPLKRAE